jgi:hypothetical protein
VGETPLAEQQRQKGAVPALIGLDAQRQQVMEGSLARALTALEAAQRPSAGKATTIAGITEEDQKVADATGSAVADALAVEAAKALPANLAPGQVAKGGSAYRAAYEALGYTVASRVAGGPGRLYAPGGEPGTGNYGLTTEAALLAAQKAEDAKAEADALAAFLGHPYGAGAVGIPGLGPRSGLSALGPDMAAAQAALYEPEKAAAATGAAGGSGGGGGVPPWLTALLWGHGGGGGGGGGYVGGGILGRAAVGAAGIGAGIGSLGSFAGFGPEHIILTAGGIVGSGVAALGGGALLGAGAAGKLGVGMGSDAVVASSTIADTKQLYTAYEAVNKAVRVYGKDSEQAKEATKELNNVFSELGNTAGVKAEAGVAKAAMSLNEYWDKQTSQARVQASKIGMQLLELDKAYIPLVARAATENFSVINSTIKPLLAWLKGPEGMGIFLQLESEFKNEIPTAMAALTQGFEFFAKTVAYTAPLTGGFLRDLDKFFTKWNTPSEFSVWEGEMNRLIADFHVWGAFVKILAADLFDLFDKDAHTGEGIIEALTHMLDKVHEYENSTAGSAAIKNIFTVHKEEAIALLDALVPLIASFSHIYTTISPPLVHAVTDIAEAFTKVVTAIEKAGALGTWLIGLTLITAKLKVLVPLLKAAGVETGLLTAEEDKNAAAGGLDAAAQGGLAGTTGIAGASAYERAMAAQEGSDMLAAGGLTAEGGGLAALLSKSNLLKAGIYGAGGLIGGSLLASATGAKGTLASGLQAGGAGAGVGFVLGPAAGALIGTTIAPVVGTAIGAAFGFAAPYLIKGIGDLFSSGEPAFKKEAEKTASAVNALSKGLLGSKPHEAAITHALEAAHEAGQSTVRGIVTGRGSESLVGVRANLAGQARDYRKAGEEAGREYVEAFQHVRFPSRLGFLTSVEHELAKLPQQAQGEAAKTMLAYAAKLESEGRLPKGAVAGFITALEQKFSGLTAYLEAHGSATSAALAKAYDLEHAKATVTTGLTEIEQAFGVSFKHTETGTENALKFLQTIFANNKGPMGEKARELISGLVPAFETEWKAASELNAREIASINKELNSEIKQLGGSEIRAGFGGQTKPGAPVEGKGTNLRNEPTPFGKAQGGLLQIGQPGDAGHDTVGLNVGGLPIAVGAGEQVAVFNRHQQPIVNAALEHMGYGGLPGLFGAVTTPNYMASGGLIPDVVQAGLSDVRKAGKAKIAGLHSAGMGGGSLGGASFSGDWVQVMRGIAKEEGWSLADWEKVVARESGGVVSIKNPSSTAFGLGQLESMNWAAYGGGPGSSGVEQIIAMAKYIKATYRNPTAAWASETSRGFYGLGGLLGFASGGLLSFAGGTHNVFDTAGKVKSKKAKPLPHPVDAWKVHPFQKIKPLATTWWGQGFYDQLNGLLGETGAVADLTEQYELSSNAAELALQAAPHGGEFIYTPSESGGGYYSAYTGPTANLANTSSSSSGGNPEILWGNVELRQHQLEGLIGTENSLLGDLNTAWGLSSTVLQAAEEGSKERAKAILELKAKIQANLNKIKRLHEHRHALEVKLAKVPKGKKATAADHAEAKKLGSEINSTAQQIKSLEAENVQLGGNATSIGDAGKIGTLDTQVSELHAATETVKGDQHTLGGLTEHGGSMLTAQLTLQKLGAELTAIGGPALELKLAEAKGGGTGESPLELKERELVQAQEQLKIKTANEKVLEQSFSVFSGPGDIGRGGLNAYAAAGARGMLIPASWIPSFDVGGVVPGARGAPSLALVHGQEEILTPEQREWGNGPPVHFEQHNHMMHPSDPAVLTEIGKASVRGMRYQGSRLSKRLAPGV